MKAVIHTPYGSSQAGSGLIFLVGNYLSSQKHVVAQLQCNGLFSACDRDATQGWRRTIDSCARCIRDQGNVAAWATLGVIEGSQYLLPDEIEETKRWLTAVEPAALVRAELRGHNLFALARNSFAKRTGCADPDLNHRRHEPILRRLLLASARMILLARRFNNHVQPDINLVMGGDDVLTASFVAQTVKQNKDLAVFSVRDSGRAIEISCPLRNESIMCELVLDSVATMRADVRTWPPEIVATISGIVSFLGLDEQQLQLPIAQ